MIGKMLYSHIRYYKEQRNTLNEYLQTDKTKKCSFRSPA